MEHQFTPAALRALAAAANWAPRQGEPLGLPEVLLGLLDEPECRGAAMLTLRGVDLAAVRRRWPQLQSVPEEANLRRTRFSAALRVALGEAQRRLNSHAAATVELATEHLLFALVAGRHEVSGWLAECGFDADRLEAEILQLYGIQSEPLNCELPLDSPVDVAVASEIAPKPASLGSPVPLVNDVKLLRLLDAAANRAAEAMRVIEDFVRFVLDDRHLSETCKQMRHELTASLAVIPYAARLASRDTPGDVGTRLTTEAELRRADTHQVLAANFGRLEQSLRSLEEFGKLADARMATRIERLRYQSYTVQSAIAATAASPRRLDAARLYVLVDGRGNMKSFERLIDQLIEAGVHLIQLRDKQLCDRELIQRARRLSEKTAGRTTRWIMNDRPDLARLARADGVHVGQDELSVAEVRAVAGINALIGVSTHSLEQARAAVLDGADYLGVGPIFTSATKHFDRLPGLDLARAVAAEIRRPAFAIGGINPQTSATCWPLAYRESPFPARFCTHHIPPKSPANFSSASAKPIKHSARPFAPSARGAHHREVPFVACRVMVSTSSPAPATGRASRLSAVRDRSSRLSSWQVRRHSHSVHESSARRCRRLPTAAGRSMEVPKRQPDSCTWKILNSQQPQTVEDHQ